MIQLTGRLQAGTANKEAVDVGLLGQLAAVLLSDGATVDDTDFILSLGRDVLTEPLADRGMDLLGLLSGSDLAGTDSPERGRPELEWCSLLLACLNSKQGLLTRRARRR